MRKLHWAGFCQIVTDLVCSVPLSIVPTGGISAEVFDQPHPRHPPKRARRLRVPL
ncbi:MAG: hypothetical protein ACRDFX_12750 [Chloroflexota bacterium]